MNASLTRLFHPLMQGVQLTDSQNRAEAQYQFAHNSEARALRLQCVYDLGLLWR
jgi:hypothetical protein